MDYIVQSILDPNASVKEEYLTKTIFTGSGLSLNGIVVERNKQHVTLKDATGKRIKIAATDIEEEAKGKTLMPEGVTRILTKAELLDLIRFVSELGKPGPYAMPTASTVQRWKKLRSLNTALKDGVPNREVVRDSLLAPLAASWEPVYSLVNGNLPLEEIAKRGATNEPIYLQSDIQVHVGGPLEFVVAGPSGTAFWIDEEPYEKTGASPVTLTPGRHRITLRTVAGASPSSVRVELRKPADSRVQFELPLAAE
jgi:putative heme-binding domain-containing protein